MKETKNIISFGGGVNSVAMIIEMIRRKIRIDEIIFSDPGNEMPETYKYIDHFNKFLESHQLSLTIVTAKEGTIYDYYFRNNVIPFRMFRSCTDKFKIRPINRYLKEKYPGSFFNMYIGIDSGESQRAKEIENKTRIHLYPLVDWDIDRDQCKEIIKKEGLKVPIKSGCYFCPFQSVQEWKNLLKESPDLFDQSITLEKNGRMYPEATLFKIPLEKIKRHELAQTDLSKFIGSVEKCHYCHL